MGIADILRMIAPEFKTVGDDDLNTWIELAKPYVSKKQFGALYEQAVAYLAAHKMKMGGYGDTSNGTVGESLRLSSVSEGDVSVSFSAPTALSDADAELTLTIYGLSFLNIRRKKIMTIVTSGGVVR